MKYLYPLLLAAPVVLVAQLLHWDEMVIFIAASLAIIPLAGILGSATGSLAQHTGPRVGPF